MHVHDPAEEGHDDMLIAIERRVHASIALSPAGTLPLTGTANRPMLAE
jgi:hypothetical protein